MKKGTDVDRHLFLFCTRKGEMRTMIRNKGPPVMKKDKEI